MRAAPSGGPVLLLSGRAPAQAGRASVKIRLNGHRVLSCDMRIVFEQYRRECAKHPKLTRPIHRWWLVPMYVIVYLGQLVAFSLLLFPIRLAILFNASFAWHVAWIALTWAFMLIYIVRSIRNTVARWRCANKTLVFEELFIACAFLMYGVVSVWFVLSPSLWLD